MTEYAKTHDGGFFDRHEQLLIRRFQQNQKLINSLPFDSRLALLNSPQHQHINQQRMHLYEVKVGIQKSWIGPDWLARWYQ